MTQSIAPLCRTDALDVGVSSGAPVRKTTGPPIRPATAWSFNTALPNAWGQVVGTETRQLGIAGIYGPQLDITRFPDFDRPHTSNGPTEATNGRLEHLRGPALGFRNLTTHIAITTPDRRLQIPTTPSIMKSQVSTSATGSSTRSSSRRSSPSGGDRPTAASA